MAVEIRRLQTIHDNVMRVVWYFVKQKPYAIGVDDALLYLQVIEMICRQGAIGD